MSVIYSQAAINARLNGVVTVIGSAGQLRLLAGGSIVSTIILNNPAGNVGGGILTFSGPLQDPAAAGTGSVTTAQITSSAGSVLISGLTVGPPLSGADVIITNGLNSTLISAGQAVTFLGAQIVGS